MLPRQNFPTLPTNNSICQFSAYYSDTILLNHLAALPKKQSFTFAEKIFARLNFQFCGLHEQIKWCRFIIHAVIHSSISHSWKILSKRSKRLIWQYFVQLSHTGVLPQGQFQKCHKFYWRRKNIDEILPHISVSNACSKEIKTVIFLKKYHCCHHHFHFHHFHHHYDLSLKRQGHKMSSSHSSGAYLYSPSMHWKNIQQIKIAES